MFGAFERNKSSFYGNEFFSALGMKTFGALPRFSIFGAFEEQAIFNFCCLHRTGHHGMVPSLCLPKVR